MRHPGPVFDRLTWLCYRCGEKPEYHGYGKNHVVDHGKRRADGKRISTVYAHQSRILVREGDWLSRVMKSAWLEVPGILRVPIYILKFGKTVCPSIL